MIRPTPHNAAGHALAMIVDQPGELDNEIIGHRLWPCPFTGPVADAKDWRRRVGWRKAAAARAAVLLGRLTEARCLEPATHLRLSADAVWRMSKGATVRDLLGLRSEVARVPEVRTRSAVLVAPGDYVPRVVSPPVGLRERILAALPARPVDLARLLGRRVLCGADKRVLVELREGGVVALVGDRWPSARGVEVVGKWREGVAATGVLG